MVRLTQYHRRLVLQGAHSLPEKFLLCLLFPCSLLYGSAVWLRAKGYELGLLKTYRATVPVVSVGNLAVGGTGKTPVVDLLVKELTNLGYRPAIVSRGYGGKSTKRIGVVSDGVRLQMSAIEAGDEPYLLARRNPQAPVLIAKKRAQGVQYAISHLAADLILLDDGFQHRAVARDVDLVLLDGTKPLGNGLPLPAGLLREFPAALCRADLLLLTRTSGGHSENYLGKATWRSQHRLADEAVSLDGNILALEALRGKRILAFAGIAEPQGFFRALAEIGLDLENTISFSDHEAYAERAVQQINRVAESCEILLTTEKDGVKLAPDDFSIPCYQVPVSLEISEKEGFMAELQKNLRS